jgi:hypothetical protein
MTDTPRMILGADGHGAFGAFATLPGYDVTTTDPADLAKWAFRSDWPRVENLHQVGRITGLNKQSSFSKVINFPELPYSPFVSVRYERGAGILQDDPWSKCDSPGTDAYMTPYRVLTWSTGFKIGFPVGSSVVATAPAPPQSAIYFVWKIAAGTP